MAKSKKGPKMESKDTTIETKTEEKKSRPRMMGDARFTPEVKEHTDIPDVLAENFNNVMQTFFQRQQLTFQMYGSIWNLYANIWIAMNPFK